MAPVTRSQTQTRLAQQKAQNKKVLDPLRNLFEMSDCTFPDRLKKAVTIFSYVDQNFDAISKAIPSTHRLWMIIYEKIDELCGRTTSPSFIAYVEKSKDRDFCKRHADMLVAIGRPLQNMIEDKIMGHLKVD